VILSRTELRKLEVKNIKLRGKPEVNCRAIVDDYRSGKSMNRLAFEHSTNDSHIRRILVANNIAIRSQKIASSFRCSDCG